MDEDEGILIGIAGVGGAGSNCVQRLTKLGAPKKARLMAFNTDKKHLSTLDKSIDRMLIGPAITKGLGTGGFPAIGEKSALASKKIISQSIRDLDLVFICAGMGGGTGTGAAPIIAQMAKDQGALVIGVVTYPFKIEKARLAKAQTGISKMADFCDTTVVIDNERLYHFAPNLAMDKAFELADSLVAKAANGIVRTILEPSLLNLDFADLTSAMSDKGLGMIAVGEGSGYSRVQDTVESLLKNSLLDADISEATGALLHFTGGSDLTLGEVNEAGEAATKMLGQNANVLFGARAEPEYDKHLEAFAIYTGISSPLLISAESKAEE